MCKLVTGLLNNKCKLFSGRDSDFPELTAEDLQAALSYAADREHKILIAS
jgi:hypothetical protein